MHTHPISPAGVMIFLMWKDKFLLILRDVNDRTINPNTWSPVTGGVEIGETFFQAIERELGEEIGVVPKNFITLGVSAKGNCFFFGRLTDEEKNSIVLGEGQRYDFFSYEELPPKQPDFPQEIKGAFRIYLDNFPEVFQRMSEDLKFQPKGDDFGLANWTSSEPDT
jgi:8-oxo-dGTP pyrophosphatase MutT (NUDIX family)